MGKQRKNGVDVSVYQGVIDWKRAAAAGMAFAMIKATQGSFTDRMFLENVHQASKAGLSIGVYHYLTARNAEDVRREAAYFISVIRPYREKITLYAAVDVEDQTFLPKDKKKLTDIVNMFCALVRQAGYRPAVYTNPDFLTYRLNSIAAWPLWLALWRDRSNLPSFSQYPNLVMWQWGTTSVDGIPTVCDADILFEDVRENKIDYASAVVQLAKLAPETRAYLEKYKYAEDLFRKLYDAMRK